MRFQFAGVPNPDGRCTARLPADRPRKVIEPVATRIMETQESGPKPGRNDGKSPDSVDLPPVATLTLTPLFKLIFLSVLGLTVLSLAVSIGANVYLSQLEEPSEDLRRLIETCSTTYKLGFGAIIGLVSGKAL